MKKIIAAVSTLFIAVALSLIAVAAPASAHTATLTGAYVCSNGAATVTWTVDNDWPQVVTITASSNHSVVAVDTTVGLTPSGAKNDTTKTFTQTIPAPAAGKSASLTLSFEWTDGTKQTDTSASVHVSSSDCAVPPSKDASAAINDTAATCTSPETVSEGAVTNATWTHSHVTSSSYSFTATASSGHEFSNGQTTETFSGNINGELGGTTCNNTTTKVTICHATGSHSNPYVSESVSYDSILPAPAGHGNAGVNAGDIIPPFSYVKNGVDGSYPGSNWDTAHQAIYNNGCVPPPPPVCIPNSAVSFHYSQNDANNGYIKVTDVANSTGQLCNPFWVTATSWTFTNSSSPWPQNRDVVDNLGEISAPGTYDFAAQVTCGQGDIYASFDSSAPSLNPGPVLNGSNNPFAEHFLSDMGFSGSATPTYTVDNPSCFVPIQETGTPVSTVLTCTAGSSNSLTLPAVPGGVWTVTSTHYSHTYAIGTGVTGFTPTYFEKYTIVLSDGSPTDGYVITGSTQSNTSYWTPVNPKSLDCNTTVTPGTPTAVAIDRCDVDGSITIPDTTGVVYSLDHNVVPAGTISPLSGSHTVTAAPAPGYEFKYNATTVWHFNLHSESTCAATIQLGTCTADGNVSSVPVSLILDNTHSSGSASFLVKIDGVTYDTYTVAGHKSVVQSVGSAPSSGETIDVYINGSTTPVELTVGSFDGCVITNVPADPSHTDISCTGSTTVLGSITVDGNPELTYTLHLPDGSTEVFPSGQPSTISGLTAGDYSVSVVANTGYVLGGSGSFPATVTILNAVDCIGTELTPVVSSVAPTCAPNPPVVTSSQFNAALAEVQGTITIPSDPNMTFTIDSGSGPSAISSGTYIEPDGTYTVVATLTSTAIADGFTFGPSAGYTRSAGNTVATFTPIVFDAGCLPTLASWHSGATGTPAVCTLTGGQSGTITLVHGSDAADQTDESGKVTYTLVNLGNNATTNLGSTALTVNVAPGSYEVEAVPTDAADGLVGNPNVKNEIDYFVTIAAATAACDGNLAFTGGTIGWFGFALAGGMLFLGIAFLYMKRRGNRATE